MGDSQELATPLVAGKVWLRHYPVSAVVDGVRERYVERFGEHPEPGGWYHRDDWHRISFALDSLEPGGTVLDVGVGAGQFLNALALSGRFSSVTGVDKNRFNKYVEFASDLDHQLASIDALPFPDDSFDVVSCMEVLEHLPNDIYEQGLSELRRVCRGQLLMTVPYREPEPIYHGHRRRYEDADILATFPDAEFVILRRPGMPWIVAEERFDGRPPRMPGVVAAFQPPKPAPGPVRIARLLARKARGGVRRIRCALKGSR